MNDYKTESTSLHSAKLVEPIIIEEKSTTRKVLFVNLNDINVNSGETVSISIVHQQKKNNDEWENVDSIN